MVLHKAEYALIVVTSSLWAKCDNDSLRRVRLNNALGQRDREQIALICEKLKARRQVTIVDNIQKTVGCLLSLNFTEMDRLVGELNIVAVSLTLTTELNLISSKS